MYELLETFERIKQAVESVVDAFRKPPTRDDYTLVN